ncbi:F-box domain [Dillenia turbinata]|uniref:F-box domain n=1 Tax=Dillenia turbinata TaxID=194707 RepID=A0AAN8UWY4_9MAGN
METESHNLPVDVLRDILLRLPGTSLVRLKRVCKRWCSLISEPYFAKLHLETRKNDLSGLVLLTYKDGHKLHISSLDESPWNATNMQIVNVPKIDYMSNTCNGLVCLYGDWNNIHLYNLTTRKVLMTLPSISEKGSYGQFCILGFDTSLESYKVVRFRRTYSFKQVCEVFTFGTTEWKILGNTPYQPGPNEPMLANQTVIYWIIDLAHTYPVHHVIYSFDITQEVFKPVQAPQELRDPEFEHGFLSLANLGGELYMAGGKWYGVTIWKLVDHMNNVWNMEYKIIQEARPNVHLGFGYIVTLLSLKNGKLLFKTDKLLWYDLDCGTMTIVEGLEDTYVVHARVFVESLLSPL